MPNIWNTGGIALVASLLWATPSYPQSGFRSAGEILPGCREAVQPATALDFVGVAKCQGIIIGIVYASPGLCMPVGGVSLLQTTQVVVNYASRVPTRWREPFTVLADEALTKAWPCK